MQERGQTARYSDDELIASLREAARKKGRSLTRQHYSELIKRPSGTAIVNRFGSWENALKTAGLLEEMEAAPLRGPSFSEEALLRSLREVADEAGKPPSMTLFRRARKKPSPETIKRRFGTWDAALKAAALLGEQEQLDDQSFTDAELLKALKEAAEQTEKRLTIDAYQRIRKTPSAHTIRQRFGSWKRALDAAGLLDTEKPLAKNEFTEAELFAAMKRAAAQTEGRLTMSFYRTVVKTPSDATIRLRFGSWTKALEAAGLLPKTDRRPTEG